MKFISELARERRFAGIESSDSENGEEKDADDTKKLSINEERCMIQTAIHLTGLLQKYGKNILVPFTCKS
jgi:hypothetical protein